jgi:hypothetical protein
MKPKIIKNIATYVIFIISIIFLNSLLKNTFKWWYFPLLYIFIRYIVSFSYLALWGVNIYDLIPLSSEKNKYIYIMHFQYKWHNKLRLIIEVNDLIEEIEPNILRGIIYSQTSLNMIENTINTGSESIVEYKYDNDYFNITFKPF